MNSIIPGKLFITRRVLDVEANGETYEEEGTLAFLILRGTPLRDNYIYPVNFVVEDNGDVSIKVHAAYGDEVMNFWSSVPLCEMSPNDIIRNGIMSKRAFKAKQKEKYGD